ncbi:MAG: DUF3105 domain-containing protein [Actinomycetota bacterium]
MERRHEAEREVRYRRRRRLVIIGGVLVAILGIVGVELLIHRPTGEERAVLAAAPRAARLSGCGPVRTIPPFPGDRDRSHIGGSDVAVMPPLSDYPSTPPVSGPHDAATLPSGVYRASPPVERAIHSLEHAAVIVWYDPPVTSAPELERIRRFFSAGAAGDHVIVAPYDYPADGGAGRLPPGIHMALAAWGRLQLCRDPDLTVARGFVLRYRFDAYQFYEYRGEAPERWFAAI